MPKFFQMPSPPPQAPTQREDEPRTSKIPKVDIPSASVEEYLEAIFRLLSTRPGKYAKTGDLAAMLKVAPASVTQMIQKLAAKKYLDYKNKLPSLLCFLTIVG